jgi:hypothetical protein
LTEEIQDLTSIKIITADDPWCLLLFLFQRNSAGLIPGGKAVQDLRERLMSIDPQLLLLCLLVGAIHLISTLSYGIRIAGVRTGRLAFSLALFNVLVLCSRSSNAILAPLLSKRVELSITDGSWTGPGDFRVLLLAASLATVFGAFLIPSCQRIVTAAVNRFESKPSMIALALAVAKPASWRFALGSLTLPAAANMSSIRFRGLPWGMFGMNILGIAFISCGVFSSLCAGHLAPQLRLTAGNLSALVNFMGTLLLFGFVDPHFSFVSDKVVSGQATEPYFRRCVTGMAASRVLGTLLAQVVLMPGAVAIAWVARKI